MTEVDIIGAGVVGSIYACQLSRAGHDVRLVARGEREKALVDGVVVHDTVTGEHLEAHPEVATSARASADVVLMAVGAHQLADAVSLVPAGDSPVVFLGNGIVNTAAGVDPERAIVGFTGAGGTLRSGEVRSYDADKGKRFPVTLDGRHPMAARVAEVFRSADIPVDLVDDIVAWRLTHHAVVVAMAGALDLAGGDAWRLAHTPDIQRILGRAVKESYTAIRRTGDQLTPPHLARLGKLPEPLLRVAIRQMFSSDFGIRRFEAHYAHAQAELPTLAAQLEELLTRAGVAAPAARLLCARLQAPQPSLIVGSADLKGDRSAAALAFAAVAVAMAWRTRRRR